MQDPASGVVYKRIPEVGGWRASGSPDAVPVQWPVLFHASDRPLREFGSRPPHTPAN